MTRQLPSALRRLSYFGEIRLLLLIYVRSADKEADSSRDYREEIVEIVCYASGELPHGFHLLRLPELALERGLLRDVAQVDDNAFNARNIEEIDHRAGEDSPRAVLVAVARLPRHRPPDVSSTARSSSLIAGQSLG